MSELLQATGISKRFGGLEALAKVSFSIRRAEIYGLIGPNGAGKTTLFNCLSGLYVPEAGEFRFDGGTLREPDSLSLPLVLTIDPAGRVLEN